MPRAENDENENLPSLESLQSSELFNVRDKVCVVTGGGSGIGAMISAGLVANGAKVYIASRKDLTSFANSLSERGTGICKSLKLDLTKDRSVLDFCQELSVLEPRGIDILVNNSGTNWSQSFSEYSMKGWDKVYGLNTRAVFFLTQQLSPLLTLKASHEDPSRVINISSIAGESIDRAPTFAYNSGKAATTHLGKHLAAVLSHKNITVNTICPGFFPSRMTRGVLSVAEQQIVEDIPMRRLGSAHDMISLILYLCGTKSGSWITGAKFIIDGGQTIGIPNSVLSKM